NGLSGYGRLPIARATSSVGFLACPSWNFRRMPNENPTRACDMGDKGGVSGTLLSYLLRNTVLNEGLRPGNTWARQRFLTQPPARTARRACAPGSRLCFRMSAQSAEQRFAPAR